MRRAERPTFTRSMLRRETSSTRSPTRAVRLSSFMVKVASYPVRILQTGQVQSYALFIVIGAIVFFGYFMVGK